MIDMYAFGVGVADPTLTSTLTAVTRHATSNAAGLAAAGKHHAAAAKATDASVDRGFS